MILFTKGRINWNQKKNDGNLVALTDVLIKYWKRNYMRVESSTLFFSTKPVPLIKKLQEWKNFLTSTIKKMYPKQNLINRLILIKGNYFWSMWHFFIGILYLKLTMSKNVHFKISTCRKKKPFMIYLERPYIAIKYYDQYRSNTFSPSVNVVRILWVSWFFVAKLLSIVQIAINCQLRIKSSSWKL